MELISIYLHRLWLYYKFLCSTFSKGTQPNDCIKCNIIRKLAYKVKSVIQSNGHLITFFGNLRIVFFQIS